MLDLRDMHEALSIEEKDVFMRETFKGWYVENLNPTFFTHAYDDVNEYIMYFLREHLRYQQRIDMRFGPTFRIYNYTRYNYFLYPRVIENYNNLI